MQQHKERGSIFQRRLDFWLGIPLVAVCGGARKLWRAFFAAPQAGPQATPRASVPNSNHSRSSPAAPHEVQRVGVLALGAIGDLLLVSALLSGLRRQLPGVEIEIVSSLSNRTCCELLPPHYTVASFAVKDFTGMVRHMRSRRYDVLIDTGQWARISALAALFSGAGTRVGFAAPGQFRHYGFDNVVPHQNTRHELHNFLALGRALFPELDGEPEIAIPERPTVPCPPFDGGRAVICHMWPSGFRSYLKEWPVEYWVELAQRLSAAGYVPVFTGGPEDAEKTELFCHTRLSGIPHAVSIAGAFGLADLACHMRRAAAVVSVNTGIMHLAAIAGAPTIGLHGPTNPLRWGPVGPRVRALLPEQGHCAYLNLGFEYPKDDEIVLRHLPVRAVLAALKDFGLAL